MKGPIEPGDLVEHRRTRERGPVAETCDERCRLLVKAASLAERWPTDIGDMSDERRREGRAFRVFAAKVADAVTVFVLDGGRIGHISDGKCKCPLGCFTEGWHPGPSHQDLQSLGTLAQRDSFIRGFDGHRRGLTPGVRIQRDYYRLGAAYRARFLRAKTEAA